MPATKEKFDALLEAIGGDTPGEPSFEEDHIDLEEDNLEEDDFDTSNDVVLDEAVKLGMSERKELAGLLKKVIGSKAVNLSVTWWGDRWANASLKPVTSEEFKKIKSLLGSKKIGGRSLDVRHDSGLKTLYIDVK